MSDERVEPRGGSGAMFDRIARRYDLLNRVLSFGNDQRWRRRAVRSLDLDPARPARGDLSFALISDGQAVTVAVDANRPGVTTTVDDDEYGRFSTDDPQVHEAFRQMDAKITMRIDVEDGGHVADGAV